MTTRKPRAPRFPRWVRLRAFLICQRCETQFPAYGWTTILAIERFALAHGKCKVKDQGRAR